MLLLHFRFWSLDTLLFLSLCVALTRSRDITYAANIARDAKTDEYSLERIPPTNIYVRMQLCVLCAREKLLLHLRLENLRPTLPINISR